MEIDMSTYMVMRGKRIKGSEAVVDVEDEVALDSPINIIVNDEVLTTLYATPDELTDLAVGFLASEGLIRESSRIRNIVISDGNIKIYVDDETYENLKRGLSISRLILSSCGAIDDYIKDIGNMKPVASRYSITLGDIDAMVKMVNRASRRYKGALALHVSCLFEDLSLKYICSDVNRHVTIDKVIGKGLRGDINFDNTVLVTSGRLSADMILKSGRVGIPIAISLRGPLYSGIYMASQLGITCIALTHGKGFTVYSYPERIRLS
jgi:FdhD protein